MKIVTWNINGVKARLETLCAWLRLENPDVVLLQEIKSTNENFPSVPIEDCGYNIALHGQKGFNGVAILSKRPIEDVECGFIDDPQSRWISALVPSNKGNMARVCNLYLPNGNPVPGPKYDYKINWMKQLAFKSKQLLDLGEVIIMAGDYNVIPTDADCANPQAMEGDAAMLPQTRAHYRAILNQGWIDAYRTLHPNAETYSFWDYQAGCWSKNNGLGIDHMLLSPQAADLLIDSGIQKQIRAEPTPSDHVPVWCVLDL